MSLVQPQQAQERRTSPVPPLNAPTNNPFRKGLTSPTLASSFNETSSRTSTNPFLDNPFDMNTVDSSKVAMSPPRPVSSTGENEPLLKHLSLNDRTSIDENMPPPVRNRHPQERSKRGEPLDIFADPPPKKSPDRRPRRNSDTSIVERRPMDEEERKRRERRHRDREHRQKDSQGRPIPSSSSRSKKPSRRLDVIDKLDVTSIYGTGLFHHDGPFDACNPHRNRKGTSRAPMQAFPKGSANNVIGGSGPVHKNIDIDRFHGRTEDSFADFNSGKVVERQPERFSGEGGHQGSSSKAGESSVPVVTFNPGSKVDEMHGDESLGLGTSTFLEGAPAARAAIQRRESEGEGNGLGRKKSLAQKIRGINRPRRGENGELADQERTTSPEALSGGGSAALPKINEGNPFFKDYDQEYEKKGASIRIAEGNNASEAERSRVAPTELKRSVTEGSYNGNNLQAETPAKSVGFMNRVKSLRGGGRGKPRPGRLER